MAKMLVTSSESMGEFDELDHVPLISRQKSLLSSKRTGTPRIDAVIKNEDRDDEDLLLSPSVTGMDHQLVLKQSPYHEAAISAGVTSEVSNSEVLQNSSDDVGMAKDARLEEVEVNTLYENMVLSIDSAEVKVENSDNNVLSALGDGVNDFVGIDAAADTVHTNTPVDFADDDLDHIVLKERRRMLLQRRCLQLENPVVEGTSAGFSEDLVDTYGGRINEDTQSAHTESSITSSKYNDISPVNASSETIIAASSFTTNQDSEIPGKSLVLEAPESRKDMENCETMCYSDREFKEFNSCDGQCDVQPGSSSMHIPSLHTSAKVKVEPVENSELNHSEKNSLINCSFKIPVKSEKEIPDELHEDGVDYMPLQVRMKKRTLVGKAELNCTSNVVHLSKTVHPALQDAHLAPQSAKPIRVERTRKRKKTATDSVETALEEDAPGLLRVLREQGVSVDEIKLYGETESDDVLEEELNEDSFSELEEVISKLFSQRDSLLKSPSVRCTKDSKPSYCLACLFSLVEQARYLQFRKWPVEWGWCRDLHSFIFVFKRHNRIVLERPEYGYATYFFELVDLLPLDWQIKRLVTTMKLTSCGRINLIENKSLTVGEDLTEGEAKVLMEFGWVLNTGLGTMLNYRDRVFHDRKNEKDTSEWRSKIGKLLVDGYNGGTIISTNIPYNVIKNKGADGPDIKLESD
ncbi:uncharacterized protein LOC102623654 isoform X2 [Citrus sinensis]|uniref:uncharacterized protein LOC102623654 isoform X2 n=1 Tax=Citrus sinensis TaxID=2711 RepID=UPI0022798F5F|nr:uncharacterized protein LOC102623654 isoform X2 [Citrus sinensis]